MALPAIPLIYWVGGALVAAGWFGGKEMGREIGQKTANLLPWAATSALAIAAYKASQK